MITQTRHPRHRLILACLGMLMVTCFAFIAPKIAWATQPLYVEVPMSKCTQTGMRHLA